MIIDENAETHVNNIPIAAITSIAAAICFLVVIAIFVSRLFQQAGSCCSDLCRKKERQRNQDVNENIREKKSRPLLRYEPLNPKHKQMSYSMDSLVSFKYAVFEIPGRVSNQLIQPQSESVSFSTLSVSDSVDTSSEGRVFLDELVQPSEKELFINKSYESGDTDKGLNPSLYSRRSIYRKSREQGSCGKVRFTLQYEDKSKKKMIMTLHEICGLEYNKGYEHVVAMYVSVLLLPERDYRFQTKKIDRAENVDINEMFVFHSRPHNRDFESRTIHLTVTYVDKSMKEYIYGESRLPLLSHEIYSQITTNISIGVKYCPPHNEIGDAQILLSYSSYTGKLSVLIKTIKFINPTILENLTGIHMKAHLTNITGERIGKKRSVSKSLHLRNVNVVEFEDQMLFVLPTEQFFTATLKLYIHGKHKIMGKHTSLGKLRIGEYSRDEAGKVHWKIIFNSESVAWTVWHPIYN